MNINENLYSALKELNIIDKKVLDECVTEAEAKKSSLDTVLLSRDLITDDNLGKIIGDLLSVPYVNLAQVSIPSETLHLIPEKVAKDQQVIAFKQDEQGLHIALADQENIQIQRFLSQKTDLKVIPYYTTQNSLLTAFSLYSANVKTAFAEIIAQYVDEAKIDTKADPPIIKIVDTIINYAYQNNASDIHIEPLEKSTLVRFRIDGILHDIVELPMELSSQIANRIKVMANLRTDEHQEAQDGKILYKTSADSGHSEDLDIRVSIAAITKGEKIVMRLLSEHSRHFSLNDLGLSPSDIKKVEAAYHNPHGMVLATGPTGSGKTTTLYAILKLLNKPEVNIMTIEDPVEYDIEHVNQIQVNTRANITFAKGLRSIVRQDPNIILVGEIRDEETADIAVNSALTGHLVLSTLHTNDAVTTFPRLTDMKIEPYLVASTIKVVIAQRLVRKICPKCKISQELMVSKLDDQIKKFFNTEKLVCYVGKGCPVCNNTGYSGRVGIFEVLELSDDLRESIINKKSSTDLEKLAKKNDMKTMLEDGIEKVKQGVTTIEELLRVTKES